MTPVAVVVMTRTALSASFVLLCRETDILIYRCRTHESLYVVCINVKRTIYASTPGKGSGDG